MQKYTEKAMIQWTQNAIQRYLNPYMLKMGYEFLNKGIIPPRFDDINNRVYQISPRCYFSTAKLGCGGYFASIENEICIHEDYYLCDGEYFALKTPLHEIAHYYQHQEGLLVFGDTIQDMLKYERPAEVWAQWMYFAMLEMQGIKTDTKYYCPHYFSEEDILWAKQYFNIN